MLLTMVFFGGWFKVRDFIKIKVFTRFKGMGGWLGGGMGGRCVRYGWMVGWVGLRNGWMGGFKSWFH
jgi:hypothetical protein